MSSRDPWWRAALFLVAAAFGSCSGGDDDGGGKLNFEKFSDELCQLQAPCCALAQRPTDMRACKRLMSFLSGQVIFNEQKGRACLAAASALQAADVAGFCRAVPDAIPDCAAAMPPLRGTKALGEPCGKATDCAGSTEGDVVCTNDIFEGTKGICQLQRQGKAGDGPCFSTTDPDGSSSGVASEKADTTAEGYTCFSSDGLRCNTETMVCESSASTVIPPGGSCSRFFGPSCSEGEYCDEDAELCTPRQATGMPCTDHAMCGAADYCDFDAGLCTPRRPDGAMCFNHVECASIDCKDQRCAPDIGLELKWSFVCGGD